MGVTKDIDLSSATTIQNVVDAINGSGASITASLSSSKITISDSSGGTVSNLKIEDLTGHAAADLGIAVDTVYLDTVVGSSIYRINTIGSVLRAIQSAAGNAGALTAAVSADGDRLVFTDNTTGIDPTTVEQLAGSHAAEDLGGHLYCGTLTTRRLLAGLTLGAALVAQRRQWRQHGRPEHHLASRAAAEAAAKRSISPAPRR